MLKSISFPAAFALTAFVVFFGEVGEWITCLMGFLIILAIFEAAELIEKKLSNRATQ